jgi:hypothetical protein
MVSVPSALRKQFAAWLHEQAIPQRAQAAYHKWLRYYWDFCHKYHFPHEHRESLPHFLKKLQEKRQTPAQQEQAAHAIGLYYELLESTPAGPILKRSEGKPLSQEDGGLTEKTPPYAPFKGAIIPGSSQEGKPTPTPSQEGNSEARLSSSREHPPGPLRLRSEQAPKGGKHPPDPPQGVNSRAGEQAPAELPEKTGSAAHTARTGQGASWKAEYTRLRETLQGRQYDPKVARAYTKWVRKFQAFMRSKTPDSLSSEDAGAFLTWLPTKRKMSFSKQNQVFEALLLFYRHVLKKELGVERPTKAKALIQVKPLLLRARKG